MPLRMFVSFDGDRRLHPKTPKMTFYRSGTNSSWLTGYRRNQITLIGARTATS